MKKSILALLFMLAMSPSYAHAILFSYGGEDIVKVLELPDDERFQAANGDYVDIGYLYKSVSILFVPVFNYDGRLVGMLQDEGSYIDIPNEDIKLIVYAAGETLPEKPYLSFWNRLGGKLLFIAVIGFLIYSAAMKRKKQISYFSALPTVRERLKDIVVNSQGFAEIDPLVLNQEDEPEQSGLAFVAVKKYVNTFLSVSVFDMNKITVAQAKDNSAAYFEKLIPLKKSALSGTKAAIHYMYFIFDASPSADDIAVLKSLKMKKILKASSSVPVIIDCEKMQVHAPAGAIPSKKAIQNCFEKAEQSFVAE
ncbi:hypothetical protein [Reinekea thalattae]|uniref:DUF3592 domain-containing protein n=1 Tax=Reinekea thalattae TaxID=2593301 RepID=A0A5C8Z9L3_9GAMM|nr:hypothetical protein [Reinekea thalattae]TXR54642.1 hypothetical protein FME95_08920 [Reinekea thalattae]